MAKKTMMPLSQRLPTNVYQCIQSCPDKMAISDCDILKLANPDGVDWEIRVRITNVLSQINPRNKKKFREEDFYDGICSMDVFRRRIMNEWKSEFFARPYHSFEEATDNILTAITARLYEVTTIPIITHDGDKKIVDKTNVRILTDLAKLMLDRKHGLAVQRSVTADISDIKKPRKTKNTDDVITISPEEIEAQIKALEDEQ